MIVMPKMCASAFAARQVARLAPDDDRGLELEIEPLEVPRLHADRRRGRSTAWWFVK